jgi:hypothetical protein
MDRKIRTHGKGATKVAFRRLQMVSGLNTDKGNHLPFVWVLLFPPKLSIQAVSTVLMVRRFFTPFF